MSVVQAAAAQRHTDTLIEEPLDLCEGDEEEEEFDEEDHHSWFDGSTAAKFLAAGGVAGAGKPQVSLDHQYTTHASASVTNVHRAL